MFNNEFRQLDGRKWFDRMQPQTVAIATWLLYIDGVFNLLHYLDKNEIYGAWRWNGGIMSLVALVSILCFPAGGFLMANGKRLGWYIALAASFSPFALRLMWKILENDVWASQMNVKDIVIGSTFVNFMFEAALCGLLLHSMTRNYVRTWLR